VEQTAGEMIHTAVGESGVYQFPLVFIFRAIFCQNTCIVTVRHCETLELLRYTNYTAIFQGCYQNQYSCQKKAEVLVVRSCIKRLMTYLTWCWAPVALFAQLQGLLGYSPASPRAYHTPAH
jgi:hypothetical protein